MQLDIPGDESLVDAKVCCLIMDGVLLVWRTQGSNKILGGCCCVLPGLLD